LAAFQLGDYETAIEHIKKSHDAFPTKMTGHRSDELEQYKHFSPEFKRQTTELIAGKLFEELEGTNWGTGRENEKAAPTDGSETTDNKEINGGADGARTRDLQRDRAKFWLPDLA
jgi:hypothetical protein